MAPSGDGVTPPHDLAQQVRAEQRRRWRQGERPFVEELLRAHPTLQAEREAVLEFIYNEVVLREEQREEPHLDEYLHRFPQLAQDLRRQFEVHTAIRAELEPAPPEPPAGDLVDAPTVKGGGAPLVGSPSRPCVPGYDLLQELGRGGMGVVYLARQARPERLVALKMILSGQHADPEAVARFLREAEAVARVPHANIVQIHEVGEVGGLPYLALEYVGGGNLGARVAGKPLPPPAAAALVRTLAGAIHHAHQQGVIHRDLKPANVLLSSVQGPTVREGAGEDAPYAQLTDRASREVLDLR